MRVEALELELSATLVDLVDATKGVISSSG